MLILIHMLMRILLSFREVSVSFFLIPNSSVRIATIPAFGTIMETVIQREVGNGHLFKFCVSGDDRFLMTYPIIAFGNYLTDS